jgi:hypothetical protein
MKRALLFFVVMGFATAACAQQFRWVDKDGRVQYGDTPPPGVKTTRLRPPPGGSAPAPASAAKKPLSPEASFQKRQKDAKEEEDKAAKERTAEVRRSNCEAAQASLRQIQSGQRMMTMNAAGERVFLDDAARAREEERAQKAVSESCK